MNYRINSQASVSHHMKKILPLLFLVTISMTSIFAAPAEDPLAWPPITSQTKPWAYWWWLGSAVDKTNLTKELQRYHDAGLGGVHIIPIYGAKGFEDKYIKYLSPEWMEMLGWTVSEANRLGMGVDMTTGTGWCFGGPQVTDEDANASVVVKTYDLGVGETLKQKFDRKTTQALVAFWANGKSIDLTDSISTNGEVLFSPGGNWISSGTNSRPPKVVTVYAISQKPSGQKVKRPAPGGEGWMLNLLYPQAMDDYLKPFTAAFAHYTGPKPRAQYHDSYEYKSDWSPNFFAEFEKRRGYKLQTELPALFGGSPFNNSTNEQLIEHHARVLCDYRETVSDIMAEETLPAWTKWAHSEGFITRNEAHGSPGNLLDLYATADIPETEFFSKKHNILVSKFASSAAHVAGKNLVASESCTWLAEHFTETLGEVKGVMDELFLSGVNHAFYHGCCYSPDEAGWPGWHFYAATEMNPRNSIWRDAPAINNYIARVQSVLQSGQPDNDILLYWPICDFWSSTNATVRAPQFQVEAASQQVWFENQPIGRTAKKLWDKGYAFDYVSDAQLKTAKVVGEKFHSPKGDYSLPRINMPGGNYRVILVPSCNYIPLETFKTLQALARSGATVIFAGDLPSDVSGWNNWVKNQSEYHQLVTTIKESKPAFYGGIHGWPYMLAAGMYLGGTPDGGMQQINMVREKMTDSGLSFIRRSFNGGWNYFVANRTETNLDGWITLARPAKSVVILDPMTGKSGGAAQNENGQVHLQLAAGESVILHAFEHGLVLQGEFLNWNYWQTNGQPVAITGQWNVKFIEGGPVLPADFQTTQLASWTTFPDTNTQAFAGTAKYETTFDAPPERGLSQAAAAPLATDALRVETTRAPYFLDLGDVRQSARVRVNGKDYGTLITPPFRVVVDNLKPAGNTLEVEVTSVAANRIRNLDRRGVKWKTFRDINFVDINYKPFDAADWPLTDCGLLGPVTLTPVGR